MGVDESNFLKSIEMTYLSIFKLSIVNRKYSLSEWIDS